MSSKLREALSDACYAMFNFLKTQNGGYKEMAEAHDKAKAALSAPSRNCDVGTAGSQTKRFFIFCGKYSECERCPCYMSGRIDPSVSCYAKWSLMPYKEGGND